MMESESCPVFPLASTHSLLIQKMRNFVRHSWDSMDCSNVFVISSKFAVLKFSFSSCYLFFRDINLTLTTSLPSFNNHPFIALTWLAGSTSYSPFLMQFSSLQSLQSFISLLTTEGSIIPSTIVFYYFNSSCYGCFFIEVLSKLLEYEELSI